MLNFFENLNIRLLALSVWMLFLELFLIRWISTEIRVFAYASNLVLLACFMGIGAGCYFSKKRANILLSFFILSILILAVKSAPFIKITDLLNVFYDSAIWSQPLEAGIVQPFKGIVLTLFMFSAIAAIFFPLGQLLGKMLSLSAKIITAYSVNILGNIFGIWIFSLFAFTYTSPIAWLMFASLFVVLFMEKTWKNIYIFGAMLLFSSIVISIPVKPALMTLWTPYQKLDLKDACIRNVYVGYTIDVNNANYMELLNISPRFIKAAPELFDARSAGNGNMISQYEIPFMLNRRLDDILIVGAGGGNDVAGAIRRNVKKIDAVEIDPGIYYMGLKIHPEKPYSNKRVRMYIDDARSFFKKSSSKYDVISFGLLDSHTLSSNYNNIRLDHYIYTMESFKEARNLLKEGGVMTIAFASTRPWMESRIYALLKNVFGEEPICFYVSPYGTDVLDRKWIMYIISNDMQALRNTVDANPQLMDYIARNTTEPNKVKVKITTDDWPYLYLKGKGIPSAYLCIIISLLALFVIAGKALFSEGRGLNLHFFFLGSAFLLLEFQNISKSALLFGSTWLVNAYMFTAILALILFSNLYCRYFKIRNIRFVYMLLAISIAAVYISPLNIFNAANSYFKASVIALFINIPIFFAGLIFIDSFRKYPHKDMALGSNLLGACFGGLLESLSFIVGIKALLILVFALYLCSYFFGRKFLLSVARG